MWSAHPSTTSYIHHLQPPQSNTHIHHGSSSTNSTHPSLLVSLLPYRLQYLVIQKISIPSITYPLLRLFLNAGDRSGFLSYTETDEKEVSVVLDRRSLSELMSYFPADSSSPHTTISSSSPLIIPQPPISPESDSSSSIEQKRPALFPSTSAIRSVGYPLKAIHILEGDTGFVDTSIISAVSGCLADAGFSIFYVSTNAADYVLVQESQLDGVLQTLSSNFKLIRDEMPGPSGSPGTRSGVSSTSSHGHGEMAPDLDDVSLTSHRLYRPHARIPRHIYTSDESKSLHSHDVDDIFDPQFGYVGEGEMDRHEATSIPPSPSSTITTRSKDRIAIGTLPYQLVMYSCRLSDHEKMMRGLLQTIFYPSGGLSVARFFSYTMIDGDLSLILDADAYQVLQKYQEGEKVKPIEMMEKWRALEALGSFDADEVGLVHSISKPLTAARLIFFYFSSYRTGFVLVRQEYLDDALATLSSDFDTTTNT